MENSRSSAPPKLADGLEEGTDGAAEEVVVVVVGANGEAGTALVHPPKSSSAATVGAMFFAAGVDVEGSGHPEPISFAVKVSGTFIIEAAVVDDDGGAAGSGSGGSGVLHALPPHSSMPATGSMFARLEAAGVMLGLVSGGGGSGLEMLKAVFKSASGLAAQPDACGAVCGADCGAGDMGSSTPNGSADRDEDAGGVGKAMGLAEAKLVKSESMPLDENDGARGWGAGGGLGARGGDAIRSKILPPLTEEVREVT